MTGATVALVAFWLLSFTAASDGQGRVAQFRDPDDCLEYLLLHVDEIRAVHRECEPVRYRTASPTSRSDEGD